VSKEETVKKMNDFLARQDKSDAERRIEVRLINGARQLDEAQKRLSELVQEKSQLEAAQASLRAQMQAMWDLALEYQSEQSVAPVGSAESV